MTATTTPSTRRSRRLLAALAGLLLIGFVAGCSAAFAAGPAAPAAPDAPVGPDAPVIKIMGFLYQGDLTVRANVKVTVQNADKAPHSLTAADGSFTTPIIPAGGSATFIAPAKAGTYAIGCQVHATMAGTLTVIPPASPSPSPSPSSSPSPSPSPSRPSSSPPPTAPLVTISNFAYQGDLVVRAGALLTIRNDDPFPHTFTDVGGTFTTPTIPGGATVTLQLPTARGSYQIKCNIHSFMMGVLTLT